jgi:putative redox protein
MDVVSMLNKMQVKFNDFSVDVSGEIAIDHPKIYKRILVSYKISGENIPYSKIKKAVELSTEKYCAVNSMLKVASHIDHEIIGEGIDYNS